MLAQSSWYVGALLALTAAFTHSSADSTRKVSASFAPPEALVTLVGVLDAVISCSIVAATGGFRDLNASLTQPRAFYLVTVVSGGLLLFAKMLYQTALGIAPLSLTAPYLSFTPAVLVITAYLLLGEVPSPAGVVGVCIVTLGGYLLGTKASSASMKAAAGQQDAVHGQGSVVQGGKEQDLVPEVVVVSSLLDRQGACNDNATSCVTVTNPLSSLAANGASGEAESSASGGMVLLPNFGSSSSSSNASASNATLQNRGGGGLAPFFSSGSPMLSDLETPLLGGNSTPTSTQLGTPSGPLLGGSSADCTATGHLGSLRRGRRTRPGLLPGPLSKPSRRTINAGSAAFGGAWFQAVVRATSAEPGSILMVATASIHAVTASLDKLGTVYGPSVFVYFALQRAVIGAACITYLLLSRRDLLRYFASPRVAALLLAISLLELATVVLFLMAVQHILVSYVVAIKRCNVLISLIVARLVFRESIGSRIPYVFLMLMGMSLIVLEPSSSVFHHHWHQRHH